MATPGEKKWIVIIDKAPRGPLTLSDIKALLARGLMRRNDLALEVHDDNPTAHSEWKFLWQYTEFDRRKEEKDVESWEATTLIKERREDEDENKKQTDKEKVIAALPRELADLPIEQLVPRVRKVVHPTDLEMSQRDEPEEDVPRPSGNWRQRGRTVVLGFVGIVVLLFFARSFGPAAKTTLREGVVSSTKRALTPTTPKMFDVDNGNHAAPLARSGARRPLPATPAPAAADDEPEPRSRADSRRDGPRRDIGRVLEDEDEVRDANEGDEEEWVEDEEISKRKKKKRKTKPPVEEPEPEDDADKGDGDADDGGAEPQP